MTRSLLRRLGQDRRGATVVEFAVIAPTMLLLLMGLCDLAYQSYVQAHLTGAMQKAGRDSTIQGATNRTALIDAQVMGWVRTVASRATFTSSRRSYSQFGLIKPEQFDDNNSNGIYNQPSECFTDVNGNGTWDADPGLNGQGGANDVVLYRMTVTYPRLFPLAGLIGWTQNQQITATTILKNQPWASQNVFTARRICPT